MLKSNLSKPPSLYQPSRIKDSENVKTPQELKRDKHGSKGSDGKCTNKGY